MGAIFEASCNRCGLQFDYSDGGGFYYDRYRCEDCGETIAVTVDRDLNDAPPPTIELCRCGGRFTLNAKPRCPDCRLTDITTGEVILFED
ncbi:MAG: hypothetical protein KKG47_01925 [Proteobacteria bacterium]|nr:hypothetical protein [Pseudomonadota bacterium]MBU1737335.1 hypothetical protein [Pseudomonadota bacterium]